MIENEDGDIPPKMHEDEDEPGSHRRFLERSRKRKWMSMKMWKEQNRSTWGDKSHSAMMIGPMRPNTEAQTNAANERVRLNEESETAATLDTVPRFSRWGKRQQNNSEVKAVSAHDPCGSVEESRLGTDEGSARRHDQEAEARATSMPKPIQDSDKQVADTPPTGSCWAFGPRVTSEEYAEWKQRQARKRVAGSLSPLEYANGALSPVSEANNGWFQIEVTVDSGACDTVMPLSMCEGIDVIPSLASLRGMNYEVANSQLIPNLGERRCEMITPGSKRHKSITFQVADVHKPLLSVSSVASMGYECILNKDGGWLINRAAHEAIPLQRKGNMYVFTCWLRKSPFGRQGS